MQNHSHNINRIKAVSKALGSLKDEVVFVGGATVSLYADREAQEVRETLDVDIVVQIYSRLDYAKLEEKLRQLGFSNDTTASFLGRFKYDDLIVDVMPISETILGFSNKWYKEGFETAIEYTIDKNYRIKIFDTPYFLASKIEAFKNRGKNEQGEYDGRTSNDFHDIIFVLEFRSLVWEELKASESSVRTYLKKEFTRLLTIPYIEEWIDQNVSWNSPPATYYIIHQLNEFIKAG
jgi:predicted nucleotidyltransferase